MMNKISIQESSMSVEVPEDSKMRSLRTYKDAIKALNSLQSNFATIESIKKSGSTNKNEMSIREMYEWTRRLGYKPADFNRLNIIHITGTKGKGSTCAFTQSILNQYKSSSGSGTITKIGLFTSPHLKSVRERVRINGKPIAEENFTKYFFEVWDRLSNTNSPESTFPHMGLEKKPAYFKYLTLLSFHIFMSEGVNSAIYEVGVGGEYDSTNIIQTPTVAGVSALGIDHTFLLGNTLAEIAWNKSGIFKSGALAFTVEQPEEGLNVLRSRAEEKGVKLSVVKENSQLDSIRLGIDGDFQKQNASLAIELAAAHLNKVGFSIDTSSALPEEFIVGLEAASWEGRCQTIKQTDLPINWYLDGAHTLESVEASSKWFKKVSVAAQSECKPVNRVLLFNQQSRDPALLVTKLYNTVSPEVKFDHVVFTTNVTWSSGVYSDDLVSINNSTEAINSLEVQKKLAETWNLLDKDSRKHIFPNIETSVNFIKSLEGPVEVFVSGSLHLVGGFLVVLDGKPAT